MAVILTSSVMSLMALEHEPTAGESEQRKFYSFGETPDSVIRQAKADEEMTHYPMSLTRGLEALIHHRPLCLAMQH